MSIIIPILLLFVFFIIQVPIGISLGLAGAVGILLNSNLKALLAVLTMEPYTTVSSFTFLAVPMFILMAEFISKGKISNNLFDLAHKFLGAFSGSLVIATIIANAMLGALCGSSTAAAAAMTIAARTILPRALCKKARSAELMFVLNISSCTEYHNTLVLSRQRAPCARVPASG